MAEKNNNSEGSKHRKTQIFVALIGLIGVLCVAIINNWGKFSSTSYNDTKTVIVPNNYKDTIRQNPKVTLQPTKKVIQDITNCTITIVNQLVDLHAKPDRFSRKIVKVPPGKYAVISHKIVVTMISEQSWFQILVGKRIGWIPNNTWTIHEKSDDCP